MSEPTTDLDVLSSPLFTVRPSTAPLSLAQLLARLLCGPEVDDFPVLAAEQWSYWWRFLVRCAAKALRELGWSVADGQTGGSEHVAEQVERTLRGLVPEGGWLLFQPDPGKPGFLQVPTLGRLEPERNESGYGLKPISALTGALGSKNHERKAEAIRALSPEQAIYALVEYQTAAIYGGLGNYGSQLQGSASGAGSGTPFMGARVAGSHQLSFAHDTQVVLNLWVDNVGQGLAGTVWPLWTLPWSGDADGALASTELDPAFIPLARAVRLDAPREGSVTGVWFRATKAKRVLDHTDGGALGDPFTPLVVEPKLKVRGTLEKGYDYTEVVQLLFGGDKFIGPSPSVAGLVALEQLDRDDLAVCFEGVAYEQGKTVGFHRREVRLPAIGGISWLSNPDPVRAAHAVMLRRVGEVKTALRGAARIMLSGEPKPRKNDARKVEPPAASLEALVDQVYLDHLFAAATVYEAEGAEARLDLAFVDWLSETALNVLRATFGALPCNTNQRLEREVRAEAYLRSKLRTLRGGVPDPADGSPEVTS